MEKWNSIVELVRESRDFSEEQIQKLWEKIISEFFGWSSLLGEIDSMRNLQVGSIGRAIPDIIVKRQKEDLFIIELKRMTLPITDKFKEQLFSYMKLLQINIGVLICDRIHLYYYDSTQSEHLIEITSIDFETDNTEGDTFLNLFSKNEFDKNKVIEFLKSEINTKEAVSRIRKDINEDFIIESLKEMLAKSFSQNVINRAIKGLKLSYAYHTPIKPESQTVHKTNSKNAYKQNQLNKGADMSKREAIELFKENGIIFHNNNVTYASLQRNFNWFWANPSVNCLSETWYIILNNKVTRKVHIFIVPKEDIFYSRTIEQGKLVVRIDQPYRIDLKILDESFVDKRTDVRFYKYYKKTLTY